MSKTNAEKEEEAKRLAAEEEAKRLAEAQRVKEPKVTKEMLENRIKKGDFRIGRGFKFKDGQKELVVDYKEADRNYLTSSKAHMEHFMKKYPTQKFIMLKD